MIAARLDLLLREEKDLLQDAAVLGRVFWTGALRKERRAPRMRSARSSARVRASRYLSEIDSLLPTRASAS
jgi:hypothetical protein